MNLQHLEQFAGENRTFTLYARDASNLPVDLTGMSISWMVGRRPTDPANNTAVFSKVGTVVSAPAGSFSVAVLPVDTQCMRGDYQHMAETTDGNGNIAVVTVGRLTIRPSMMP